MKKAVCSFLCILLCALMLSACGCKHEWANATCTAPKTCALCGATEGAAIEHSWEQATCTLPETCMHCRATRGSAAGHAPDAETSTTDYVNAQIRYVTKCSICGETLSDETTNLTTLHNGEVFLPTPAELVERCIAVYAEFSIYAVPNDTYGEVVLDLYAQPDYAPDSHVGYVLLSDKSATPIPVSMMDTPSCVYDISYISVENLTEQGWTVMTNTFKALYYLCDPLADTSVDDFMNALFSIPRKPLDFIEHLNIRTISVDGYLSLVVLPK